MRLPNDIRSLRGRKALFRDLQLRIACHEVSHAITSVRLGREFERVEIVKVSPKGRNTPEDIIAHVLYPKQARSQSQAKDDAMIVIAGYVYEIILNPHDRFVALLSGAIKDYQMAMELVNFGGRYIGVPDNADRETCGRFIEEVLVPATRRMVVEDWDAIMKVGEVLAARGILGYAEVVELTNRQ
jgi:hypothetical protein